jgi:uncharacterized protein
VQFRVERSGAVILGGISIGDMALLLGGGVVAGLVGSAGGIASLISYPVLLAVGLPAKPANVADTVAFVACLPGSALGSQPELQGQGRRVLHLAPLAVAGFSAPSSRSSALGSRWTFGCTPAGGGR